MTRTAITTISIQLNGDSMSVPEGTTVADLLARHDLQPVRVAVEVNEDVVRRAKFDEHILHNGDRVEIVTFVGGG